jgi:hypothetical protein
MAISGPMIVAKAKDIKEQMETNTQCTFSDGWLNNFKNRHGIRKLDIAGEKQSVDTEVAKIYLLLSSLLRIITLQLIEFKMRTKQGFIGSFYQQKLWLMELRKVPVVSSTIRNE